jgi:hypothetical protein
MYDIGKYSFANRTIKLWNNLLAEALVISPASHISLGRELGN